MNIRNCKSCGRIFNYVAGACLCQPCREKMEIKFNEVKEYIRANPGVGIPEVSEECDVEASQIRQWLREDRLEITENSPIFLNCESCGAPIRSGRYCDKCKLEMTNGFKNVLKGNQPTGHVAPPRNKTDGSGAKMRFL
ncbi:MAG: flagellar protein [Lachnospiraceae bacterium]|nr:flagellar protein [Lachnospiraceae bacterium]